MEERDMKQLLEANLKVSKENNKMLHKMRGAQKRANIFKFLYWLIIIGIAVGAFYFLQPLFEQVKSAYEQILPGLEGIGEVGKVFGK